MDGSRALVAIAIALVAGVGTGYAVGSSASARVEEQAAADVTDAETEAAELAESARNNLQDLTQARRELDIARKDAARAKKKLARADSSTDALYSELEAAYATIEILSERIATLPRSPKRAVCRDMLSASDLASPDFGASDPCKDWEFDY